MQDVGSYTTCMVPFRIGILSKEQRGRGVAKDNKRIDNSKGQRTIGPNVIFRLSYYFRYIAHSCWTVPWVGSESEHACTSVDGSLHCAEILQPALSD